MRYEDYIKNNDTLSLHPKLNKLYDTFPLDISNLKNIIFYGPKGVGKYTQMLKSIQKYSQTNLKYEKKLILSGKYDYAIKISDIHYEVDMSLLGCNSKVLWDEIYNQILEVISSKNIQAGIIVCKNFHDIHSELLDNFYSYMQTLTSTSVVVTFIILTEQLSFIPENIINSSNIIKVKRPSRSKYNSCLGIKLSKSIQINKISNINTLSEPETQIKNQIHKICDPIIEILLESKQKKNIDFMNIRDKIYDIFVYNLNVAECIWYIITFFIKKKMFKTKDIPNVIDKTYFCLHYYNNNYRPIYHLEHMICFILTLI